jgi:hypothetical protein
VLQNRLNQNAKAVPAVLSRSEDLLGLEPSSLPA